MSKAFRNYSRCVLFCFLCLIFILFLCCSLLSVLVETHLWEKRSRMRTSSCSFWWVQTKCGLFLVSFLSCQLLMLLLSFLSCFRKFKHPICALVLRVYQKNSKQKQLNLWQCKHRWFLPGLFLVSWPFSPCFLFLVTRRSFCLLLPPCRELESVKLALAQHYEIPHQKKIEEIRKVRQATQSERSQKERKKWFG